MPLPEPTSPQPSVSLGEIAAAIGGTVVGSPAIPILDVFQDSCQVLPGSLYAARRGRRADGHAFAPDALARGASALLVENADILHALGAPGIVVPQVHRVLGRAAQVVHGYPFRRLPVLGVTGTNGKTTTTSLTVALLRAQGVRPALLGTLGCLFEHHDLGGSHTTPAADDIARFAARLLVLGATCLVMEVSSHALVLDRVEDVPFQVAGFTNLSHDHLDFHGTMEAYGEAKARLFLDLHPRSTVINVDDMFGSQLFHRSLGEVLGVSRLGDPRARLRADRAVSDASGLRAELSLGDLRYPLRAPLVGAHNLENLLVALGLAIQYGVELGALVAALPSLPSVPGRLERCSEEGDDVLVLVDYAHSPDALARVLAALRPLCSGSLWCVFGCGGDRDPHKRGPMGEAAARGADQLVVTSDNPRSEDPARIAEAVVEGIRAVGGKCEVELDRARAIDLAIGSAAPGDVVLIAGKGHETYQILGERIRPFDDRVEARRALSARKKP
ncbi:MAG: UDP-N-acetylmuramoyl-L-alanyl-D-glutamate--2,6-diaminopimelate ligase [Myxococcales bacterium]|nr:UDP-N-acetylmuramoyl-L-alanyl-D-glutamate--2,6-diaminopimelate ligase [Polyangiaceae bacterium]MDW8247896.1 UDP-N-acetylmuramoyl-L-alanyl-D-glutamate--2,6-diaminopimelate ligase [Myxococcales bacterium]